MRLLPDCRQYGNYQETAFGETKTFLAGTGGDRNLCGYECEIAKPVSDTIGGRTTE